MPDNGLGRGRLSGIFVASNGCYRTAGAKRSRTVITVRGGCFSSTRHYRRCVTKWSSAYNQKIMILVSLRKFIFAVLTNQQKYNIESRQSMRTLVQLLTKL